MRPAGPAVTAYIARSAHLVNTYEFRLPGGMTYRARGISAERAAWRIANEDGVHVDPSAGYIIACR